jgi:DNA-binding transcriptional LysR family regulator
VADDYGATLGLVASGLAVATVPQLALHHPRPDVVVRPLEQRIVRRIVAMTPAAASGAARDALLEALVAAAAAHESAFTAARTIA